VLNAKINDRPLDAFVNIQSADDFKLPNDIDFDYALELPDGNSNIPFETLTKGMKNRNEGRMLLGVRNPYVSDVDVQIRYFTSPAEEGDSDGTYFHSWIYKSIDRLIIESISYWSYYWRYCYGFGRNLHWSVCLS